MSPISVLKQDDNTDEELSDDESEDPGDSTLLSDIEQDDFDYQRDVLLLGQASRDRSL